MCPMGVISFLCCMFNAPSVYFRVSDFIIAEYVVIFVTFIISF